MTSTISPVVGRCVALRLSNRNRLVDGVQLTGKGHRACAHRRQLLLACSAPVLLAIEAEQAASAADNNFVTLPSGLRVLDLRCASCAAPPDMQLATYQHCKACTRLDLAHSACIVCNSEFICISRYMLGDPQGTTLWGSESIYSLSS